MLFFHGSFTPCQLIATKLLNAIFQRNVFWILYANRAPICFPSNQRIQNLAGSLEYNDA